MFDDYDYDALDYIEGLSLFDTEYGPDVDEYSIEEKEY